MLVTLPNRRVPGRVAARQADPRVFAELLHAERDAVLLLVELEDLGGDFVADRQHFRRMLDAAPGEIGDVQQAVDAAQVDERAVVGDVLDDALDDRAFLQRRQQLLALLAQARFEHGAARDDDVVALAVELDDLEFELPCFRTAMVSLTGRMSTSEPGRNARMPLTITVRPPLTLPVTRP